MHDWLAEAYGPQNWWPAQTPFEVILGAYLTQNTAWKAVERSLANLRLAGALTIDGLRMLEMDDLRELIRPSGFYTRKAPALKAFVAMLDKEFAGSLDDEYLRRIAERHRLITPPNGAKKYDALSALTRQAFASDAPTSHARLFNEFHAVIVAVGKAHCGRNPRCEGCPLAWDAHVRE